MERASWTDDRIDERMTAIDAGLDGLRAETRGLRDEIGDLRSELRTEVGDLRSELRTEITGLRTEFRQELGAFRAEVAAFHRQVTVILGSFAVALLGMLGGLIATLY